MRRRRRATTPRASRSSLTEQRVLLTALAAPVVLGAVIALVYLDELLATAALVAAWTVIAGVFVAIAWADLRRPQSRGRIGFGAAVIGLVLSVPLLIAGSPIVWASLCLVMIAASLRRSPARLTVSCFLLLVSVIIYAGFVVD
jgi:hypothetical protein